MNLSKRYVHLRKSVLGKAIPGVKYAIKFFAQLDVEPNQHQAVPRKPELVKALTQALADLCAEQGRKLSAQHRAKTGW